MRLLPEKIIMLINNILNSRKGNYLVLNIFSVLSFVTSFLGQIIIAAKLGASYEYDAYLAAFVLPNILISIATSYVGINTLPILSEIENKGFDKSQISKFLSTTLFYIFLFSIMIILITNILSKYIFIIVLPGWTNARITLVNQLYLLVSLSFVFSSLSGILTEIANYHKKFILPAIVPALLGGILPATILLLSYNFLGIFSLAIGFLLFTLINFFFLFRFFLKNYQYDIKIKNIYAIRVLKNSFFLSLSGFVSKIQPLIENFYCSFLPLGSISILGYANRIVLTPSNIISQNFISIIYPDYARYAGKNDDTALFVAFKKSFKLLSLPLIFLAIYIVTVGKEFIELFFERGKFNYRDTNLLYVVTLGYLGYFIFSGLGVLAIRLFYVKNKNLFPITLSIIGVFLYVISINIFTKSFGLVGVSLAISLQFLVANIITYIFIKLYFKIKIFDLVITLLKYFSTFSIAFILTNLMVNYFVNALLVKIFLKTISYFLLSFIILSFSKDDDFKNLIKKTFSKNVLN